MEKKLGLYLHIPFCVKKCDYCDFLSFSADENLRQRYVEKLCNEIRERSVYVKEYCVDTIFFGGGTPSLLQVPQIQTLMDVIRESFCLKTDVEITMEANPGTVDFNKLSGMRESGINRISFGVQSFVEQELRLLGRIHTVEQSYLAVEDARRAGFDNINIDLISALPHQSLEQYAYSLKQASYLKPQHISAYGLIIEEGTLFYDRYGKEEEKRREGIQEENSILPSEILERQIYEYTKETLGQAGYAQYEISNYAKKDCECKHNLKYWEREEYLGLGLGSSSFLGEYRFQNPVTLENYFQTDFTASVETYALDLQKLTREDAISEFMFLGLRKRKGISKQRFYQCFGIDYDRIYHKVHQRLKQEGMIAEEGDSVFLTARGIDVSNYCMGLYLL